MSAAAEVLLEQFRKLPPPERQELLRSLPAANHFAAKPFPTIKISGGVITAEQAAEAVDDD